MPRDGLDEVDWASLDHAHGSAEDIPDLLRVVIGSDDEEAKEALYQLSGRITHQGSLYSATAAAVPFLIALVSDRDTRRRPELASVVSGIAFSEDATTPDVLANVRAALCAGAGRLLELLFDPDAPVRREAAYAVAHLPPEAVPLGTLRELQEAGADDEIIADLLIAAGRLHPHDAVAWFEEELGSDRPIRSRAVAAWALAMCCDSFDSAAAEAALDCWAAGNPLADYRWVRDPLSDIVGSAPGEHAVDLAEAFLRDGAPEQALEVVNGLYRRCK